MALRLVEKRRGGQDKYVWQPFQPNAGNFNPDWWERRQPTLDDPRYVQVIDDEGTSNRMLHTGNAARDRRMEDLRTPARPYAP